MQATETSSTLNSQDIITIVSICGALIGVVIGSVLTPVVSSFIEKRKTKKRIRPELIKIVYLFYNKRKKQIDLMNTAAFSIRHGVFLWEDLRDSTLTGAHREEIRRQFDVVNKGNETDIEIFHQVTNELIELEASMISLICEAEQSYNTSVYKKLNALIKPEIDKSNNAKLLYDFENMTKEEHNAVNKTWRDLIVKETYKQNDDCDRVIEEIMKIIK